MVNKTKYGVISDVHQDPRIVKTAIDVLKKQGIDKLIVNGDIGQMQNSLQSSQTYVGIILNAVAESGLEAYVQPGSHETIGAYDPIMKLFTNEYSNIIDVIEDPKIETPDHTLVFLPGSDWNAGGEYRIGNGEDISTGQYIKTDTGLLNFEGFDNYSDLMNIGIAKGLLSYQNMKDLCGRVDDPDNTIMFCHVPRKFDNIDTCVDMAEFGIVTDNFYLNDEEIEKGSVYPLQIAKRIAQAGYPVEIRKENRGNEDLKKLYEELGIRKAVNGHFHESGHRANDISGNLVNQDEMVQELFWNSGHLDIGQTGILTVGDREVSYKNINLKDHLK